MILIRVYLYSLGYAANYSSCHFVFEEQAKLHEFVTKYKDFKIYDEKGRVYPLHIDRALYMDAHVQKEG
jgi:hypothetical protein